MNTLAEIYQVWVILKDRIPVEERDEVASDIVLYLMDQGYELDDMSYQFADDRHLLSSVKFYADDADAEEEGWEEEWDEDEDQDGDPDW